MSSSKYFAAVDRDRAAAADAWSAPLAPFDFTSIAKTGAVARLSARVTPSVLAGIYRLSRRFFPVFRLAGLTHVTRDAQVRDVLGRPDDFRTPFGPEMAEIAGGATFLLGLDGAEHDRLHGIVAAIIDRADGERIAAMSRDFADALLDNSAGRIDVIGDLLKRVPAEICLRYFGLTCDDIDQFGDWTMALSAFLFGDPYAAPATRALAINAARRLRLVIDDAIARARRDLGNGRLAAGRAETLVERLVLLQRDDPLGDGDIRAILMGLSVGFIPTNTLAAARMLGVLLKRPDAMALAQAAAREDDLPAMRRIVLEAGRLDPALAPGQWRYCPRDTTIAVGRRRCAIKAGTTLMVSTMSAMRDRRAVKDPGRFDPDRVGPDGQWHEPDLVFGVGPHTCMGKHLAIEQISALFSTLLRREALRPVAEPDGRLSSIGPFPRRQVMTFDSMAATQTMTIVLVPLTPSVDRAALDAALADLGHPAEATIRAALDATGIVHFCSLAVIEAGAGHLAFELSLDGEIEPALATIEAHAAALLRPVFRLVGLDDGEPLAAFLARHVVTLHGKPWGATGLNFNGLPQFPVALVERQAAFADFVERAVQDYLATETARGSHPMLTIGHIRALLAQDPSLRRRATSAQLALMAEARRLEFDAFRMIPTGRDLSLSRFTPLTKWQAYAKFLRSRDRGVVTVPLLILFVAAAGLAWIAHGIATPLHARTIALIVVEALTAAFALYVAGIALFLFLLRRAEKHDIPDDRHAPLVKLRTLAKYEDSPGFAQNHILAVGTLKTGLLRRLIHALALWAIRVLIENAYRPGFVINMGTIHYARWWRVPGTDAVAFYSNFDGSWESYLEDFITRARQGQSAAWSNWQGFPPTRFLMADGARDGDRFKRWVRTRQQVTPFWYGRFPGLTSDQIRNNSLIHAGVARGQTLSEAESWLSCLGSMPRVENRIEADEVQSLLFGGMGGLPLATALVVRTPRGTAAGEWLDWIRGMAMAPDGLVGVDGAAAIATLSDAGIIVPVARPDDAPDEYALAHSLAVAFGERPLLSRSNAAPRSDADLIGQRAVCLGLTAAGLARFTPPDSDAGTMLDGFSPAFRMGMAGRGRTIGDLGEDTPGGWRWQDDPMTPEPADAVLLLYAADAADLALMSEVHRRLLENHGGAVLSEIACAPADDADPEREHFGFRDGIAQPVMRGTTRTTRGVPTRDLVEPGEFLFGYRNNQGYFAPSPGLPPESDPHGALPAMSDAMVSRFPDFGCDRVTHAPRDLGRNGSYLVLRELEQDVDGFDAFAQAKADELACGGYRDLYKIVGQMPDKDWVKAKIVGRWPDGRPLVGNPVNQPSGTAATPADSAAEHDNDFSYADDDPQGLACPFGAHIRRANPRDSKQPGDPSEQVITNRHRLLRRGRSYRVAATGERGLMFAALCTDIERQFEFVQQFWINSAAFHGLAREPDPLTGVAVIDPSTGCPIARRFTIPTAVGPIRLEGMQSFVRPRAGGYFFLPARSALTWLADIALHAQPSESSPV